MMNYGVGRKGSPRNASSIEEAFCDPLSNLSNSQIMLIGKLAFLGGATMLIENSMR